MKKFSFINFIACILFISSVSEAQLISRDAIIEFDAYEKLVSEVKQHRQDRLLRLDDFLKMAQEENVIIFDARSEKMYQSKHIKGAVNLNFSDFTQENLSRIIPTTETKILIYCNNNFEDDQINFATKMFIPDINSVETEPLMLALNVPTYINLYGYGYRNVYELSELISVFDDRLEFEGTSVVQR